jgi:hypothetical protein
VSLESFKRVSSHVYSKKSYGERDITVNSLFLPISFFVYFDSIYNFDNGEREEKQSGNVQTAKKGGLHSVLGEGVTWNSGVWNN